jgi:hypothetical protein
MEQQLQPPRPHYAPLVYDILVTVFEQLEDDQPTLFAAARTCRAWAPAALRVLWRAPQFDALAQDLTAERRQILGPMVRHVSLLPGAHRWQGGMSDALMIVRGVAEWRFPAARTCELAAALIGCMPDRCVALLAPSFGRLVAAAIRSVTVSDVLDTLLDVETDVAKDDYADERLLLQPLFFGCMRRLPTLTVEVVLHPSLLHELERAAGAGAATPDASDGALSLTPEGHAASTMG